MCFTGNWSLVVFCRPLPVWFTNHLQCCHGEDAAFSLLLCPKWYLRDEACEFPFVIKIQWTQQRIGYMSRPSWPHPCLSTQEIRSLFHVYYVILISEHLFPISNIPCAWPFQLNLSNCRSAAATWHITSDMLNLLSILPKLAE